jgi:phosphotransferase system enzyme I (PtsI)
VTPPSAGRQGIPASPGIVIGPAYVFRRERLEIPEKRIPRGSVGAEVARLEAARQQARRQLEEIGSEIEGAGVVRSIFEAQLLLLDDRTLFEDAVRSVREGRLNAAWALQRELVRLEALFDSVADSYIRSRSSDVRAVVSHVLQILLGGQPASLHDAPRGAIVVAEDLAPAEVAVVSRERIGGLITEGGSRTSHVTIMARSLEIPAVVGVGPGLVEEVADGARVVLDGHSGQVLVEPDPETVEAYRGLSARLQRFSRQLLRHAELPAETRDGVAVRLLANVDLLEEIPDARRYGAEGIGLYRTEFLFLNRPDLPDEDEQRACYREILEAAAPHAAVIRTLDLGGEKPLARLGIAEELNPALGLRGMRLSYARPDLFRTQLRALLRASSGGSLKILLPMVSNLDQVRFARRELAAARDELRAAGVPVDDKVQLGVMIETPAAAMIVDLIAPHTDFLSIGTNDLLQYTLAVDRTNDQVAYLYEPLHPAHLRMIQRVVQTARRTGIVVGMCGEMAGDPLHCWVLLALGLDELSMAPFAIPLLKRIVRDSTVAEARELLSEILRLPTGAQIRDRVAARMRERFPEEFERIGAAG